MQSKQNSSNTVHKLDLQNSIARFGKFNTRCKASNMVWNFLNNIELVEATNQYHAITWLEMYVIYRALAYPKPIPDNPKKARSRATACMQIREFTRTVRGIVQRSIEDEQHKHMFKPMKTTHERFLHLGVKGLYPAISASIVVDDDIKGILEQNIIALGHRIPANKVQQFCKGDLQLTPNVPNLKGRVGWDSKIKQVTRKIDPSCVPIASSNVQTASRRPAEPACFQCPRCNAMEHSSNSAFQLTDLDATCKCKSCKQKVKVKDWWCSCQAKWHACTIHQSYANICKQKQDPNTTPRAPKRSIGPCTQEQLLEIDAKRRRKSTPSVLPPTANLLSPNLRIRFAHLLQ